MKYTVGSLFAGVGGVCLGFKNAVVGDDSYQLLWANEIDEYAASTYRCNFNHRLVVGDIEKIVQPIRCEDLKEIQLYREKQEGILEYPIDILTGGFPCQAFSIAGEQKGFDDHRGNLFWSIIEFVKLHNERHGFKPRVLFLENVKNLKGHDKGNTYKVIKTELEKVGYFVKEAVVNTMDFTSIPQNRERIFIVCFLNKEDADRFTLFDKDERGICLNLVNQKIKFSQKERISQIESIIEQNENREEMIKYYYTRARFPHYFLSENDYIQIDEHSKKAVRINLDEQIAEKNKFYQLRRGMYVRQNMNNVCPTLTASMGKGGHNVPLIRVDGGIRKLTPKETFRLQGFPVKDGGLPLIQGGDRYILPEYYEDRRFSDGRLYVQAGNAVTVPMVTFIASEILRALL